MIRNGLGIAPALVVAAVGVAVAGGGGLPAAEQVAGAPTPGIEQVRLAAAQTIVAVDGRTQVSAPDGWGMSPQALWGKGETLQIADSRGSGNLLIAPQGSGNDFATFTRNVRANLVAGTVIRTTNVSEDRPMEVGGRPAVQWEVAVSNNGIDGAGWMTAIAGEHSYYLVFAWTSPDRVAADEPVIQGIVASFRELP